MLFLVCGLLNFDSIGKVKFRVIWHEYEKYSFCYYILCGMVAKRTNVQENWCGQVCNVCLSYHRYSTKTVSIQRQSSNNRNKQANWMKVRWSLLTRFTPEGCVFELNRYNVAEYLKTLSNGHQSSVGNKIGT